jgi:hypothetical protein
MENRTTGYSILASIIKMHEEFPFCYGKAATAYKFTGFVGLALADYISDNEAIMTDVKDVLFGYAFYTYRFVRPSNGRRVRKPGWSA